MSIPDNFIKLAKSNTIRNISLGYDDIYLFDIDNIKKEQVGYSIDPNGNSLITGEEGSWKANWLVIGFNENVGDPYFVDTSLEGFPVYTSMHGEGIWDPTMISDSYKNFIEILNYIQKLSGGRENPVAIEANPLPNEEVDNLISKIETQNIKSEIWYWESLLEQ
jgi:hypothetical protein